MTDLEHQTHCDEEDVPEVVADFAFHVKRQYVAVVLLVRPG